MKKLLSVFLSVCILLTCVPVACFAAPDKSTVQPVPRSAENYPVIVIRGVSLDGLYTNYGTPEQTSAVKPITTGDILSTALKAVGSGIVHLNFDSAVDEIIGYAGDVFGKLACNKDGTPVYNIGLPRYPLNVDNYKNELITGGGTGAEEGIVKSAADHYGASDVYYFTYDWRLNPLDICDEINDMVNLALAEHHTGKVNIVSCSMGGVETVAYFSKYGYEKVNKCVFLSSTFYGTYIVSDLFCGKVTTSGLTLYNFLADKTEGNVFLSFTVKALYKTGVLSLVSVLADKFIEKYKDKIYDGFLRDTFGTMPVWWGLVQPEDYNQALNYMFGGREKEYAGIIAISKDLQKLMAGRESLLKDAAAGGVEFAVVANYNSPPMPIYERACANSDGGLETVLVSGGGTVADYGKTLGSNYVASNKIYVSPDNVIDASTCIFPNSTWFVKNGEHVACNYGSQYSDFLFWMLGCNGQPTVFSSAKYPQFLISGSGQTIASLVQ